MNLPAIGEAFVTKLDAELPEASTLKLLPFAHVTVGEHLRKIADLAALVPGHCATLSIPHHPGSTDKRDLLYFTYGLPQYKPWHRYTANPLDFPVAFVFHPRLLSRLSRFYPFDTGALITGRLGKKWLTAFDLEELYTSTAPNRLVEFFYGTNDNYLDKRLRPQPPPLTACCLQELWEMLNQDLGTSDFDDRQRTIEGICYERFDLTEDVLWMGAPDSITGVVARLWHKHGPHGFLYDSLQTLGRESPHVLARMLAQKAAERLSQLFRSP